MARVIILALLFLSLSAGRRPAQENEPGAQEKIRPLFAAAIKALGGQSYLNVKSERSKGYITPYKDNLPEKLSMQSFVDYIVLPDRERVEFKGQGRRFIQANSGIQGWTYDSESELLRDQTEEQRKRFVQGLRYQLDQILRGGWTSPEVRLSYLTRQQLWQHQFGEGVMLTYADGAEVSLFFDPQTQLPLALRFPKENGNGEHIVAENRFFKYLDLRGIQTPYVVDLFENGTQVLRLNYEEREFNAPIVDKIFAKPESAKSLK